MNDGDTQSTPLKCPFRATLITRSFACVHASEVTRRDGPDIGCDNPDVNNLCELCFSKIREYALPELGYTDDLTSMPASALQKIQFGGLLGLQAQLEGGNAESISNISSLVKDAFQKFETVDQFPLDSCLDSIRNYQIKRRRGR